MRTKKRIRLKGRLRIYMQTSLYMGILLLIVDIGTYLGDKLMNTNLDIICRIFLQQKNKIVNGTSAHDLVSLKDLLAHLINKYQGAVPLFFAPYFIDLPKITDIQAYDSIGPSRIGL